MKDMGKPNQKLFGTDGIRGTANEYPMTAEMALKLGMAAGRYFRRDNGGAHRVVIGKDTRLSGYMFENALTAGFTAVGMNVLLLGPLPTPAVGMLASSMRADAGVMISASHNGHQDNGIKFFGPDGFKLSDEAEAEIEAILQEGAEPARASRIGRAKRIDDGRARYVERVKSSFPTGLSLEGLRVVVDCANGASYRAAPELLWELGAEVVPVGVNPNGLNINLGCGSTDLTAAAAKVVETRADIGLCLDGDADRLIVLDESGHAADGDQIMALLAERWASQNRLKGGALVATVMSNLGLEQHLKRKGIALKRTKVGDRYVVEEMRKNGFNLGGEQSGHLVMLDHATTGDGMLAALQVLAALVEAKRPASEVLNRFTPVPQLLKNIRYTPGSQPLSNETVKATIAEVEARLGKKGRLVIRPSGTEPLIRVMAEAENANEMRRAVDDIADALKAAT